MTTDQEITDEMLKDTTWEEEIVPKDEVEPEELKGATTADATKIPAQVPSVVDKVGASTNQVAPEVLDAQKDVPVTAVDTNLNKEEKAPANSELPAVSPGMK